MRLHDFMENEESNCIIPIVIGTLGAITIRFEKYVKDVGIEMRVEHVQMTALLGTAKV